MQESKRTLIFVVAAAVTVGLASVSHLLSKPAELADFERVGEEFYPKFTNPNDAMSLKVVDFDEDTAEIREFSVEFSNGAWRIPSHHNYPADAKDQLAKTASSIIGLKREALAGRRASDYEKFSVIDPNSADATILKGLGQKLTITGADGTVLASYIIGKSAEDGKYHVRNPDEKETYRVNLNIDLSTKFADWIEPDLLKLESFNLRKVVVDKYSIDESSYSIVGREISELTKNATDNTWKLAGLNEETEELKTSDINDLVSSLDNLKIVGVRPKPEGLRADLSLDAKLANNPLVRNALVQEMASRGFLLARDSSNPEGGLHLVSNEGEVKAGTNEGVVYTLHFGEIFSGDDKEIEIGGTKKKSDDENEKSDDAETKGEDDAKDDEAKSDDEKSDSETKRSRYLFVRVGFDEGLIEDAPQEPAKPEKPAGLKEEAQPETEEKKEGEAKAEGEEKPAENDEQTKLKEEYTKALETYEIELEKYNTDKDAFDKKIADGKKKVQELSDRFNEWYYVISAESFEKLRLTRADLVQPKKEEEKEDDAAGTGTPSLLKLPEPKKPAPEEKKEEPKKEPAASEEPTTSEKADEKPPAKKPEAKKEKPAETPAAEKPAKETKPEAVETPASEPAKETES